MYSAARTRFTGRGGAALRLVGVALAMALGAAAALPDAVQASPVIDRYFTVQPIQVCNDAGTTCAPTPLFKNETEKIYAQAGVSSVFLPTTQLNDSSLLSTPSVSDIDLPGNGQHPNPTTINMWFVQDMPYSVPGYVLFGEGWIDANGVAINGTAVQNYNGGVGRRDTIAHELGHNLGLRHTTLGAGDADNLMTSGSSRSVPSGVGDITPDGADLSQLTTDQVDEIRGSPFVVPVPEVNVDTNGSTPFDTDDFFSVDFEAGTGAAGTSLLSMTMDLTPVDAFFDPTNDADVFEFPGGDGSPFLTSSLVGLTAGDISITSGGDDGDQTMTIGFTPGAFTAGDSFKFGIDIDLLSAVDLFGATPEELIGTLFSFQFSDGFSNQAEIEDDLIASSIEPTSTLSFVGQPSGGSTLPGGQLLDPQEPTLVAEPPSLLLVAGGLLGLGFAGGRRRRLRAS